jgi:hypothetical protein
MNFEMSMMEELDFILGLQIKQTNDDIFMNQSIYIKDLLKRFRMKRVKKTDTLIRSSIKLDMDKNGKNINITKLNITTIIYLKHYKITKKKKTTILVNYMNRLIVLAVSRAVTTIYIYNYKIRKGFQTYMIYKLL